MLWELFVALRYLSAKRKERFISVISVISASGVAMGVCALIVVIAVMSGFGDDLKEKIIGTNAHIIIESEYGIEDAGALQSRVLSADHVKATAPFVSGQAILLKEKESSGVLVRGVDADKENRVTSIGSYIQKGALRLEDEGAVIGSELARSMRISVGDKILLVSPARTKGRTFTIRGTFSSGMYMYDAYLVYVGLKNAQGLFGMKDLVSGVTVKLDDAFRVAPARKTLQNIVGGFPYSVKSWMDLDRNLIAALRMEKVIMFIVVGLVIFVACFNIASSLIMMVMEKTKDIGILRSIGATAGSIRRIFLIKGFLLGFFGTAVGVLLGTCIVTFINPIAACIESVTGFRLFPKDIYYFSKIPATLAFSDVACIVAFALVTSLCATIYPAHQAARLDPIEALRYE